MNKTNAYVTFILVCLIIRYVYVKMKPDSIKISSYFPLFGLLYATTYYLTKKSNLSLFTGLLATFGRTIYRYQSLDLDSINKLGLENTILFIFGISIPFVVSHYKKSINDSYIDGFNFVGLIYVMISISEFLLHKYTMHCDRESNFVKMIKKIPMIGNEFFKTCDGHINHHLDVEKDMHIDEPSSEEGLYMGWNITMYLAPITIAIMMISRNITNYKISTKMIVGVSFVLSFIWQYIWNKVHVEMHNLENNYSIKKGPYDEGLLDLNPVTRVLFTNHANHHLQKGEKKGNFNVIVMGADDWFSYYNKSPDNVEYCKTNKQDKVCK